MTVLHHLFIVTQLKCSSCKHAVLPQFKMFIIYHKNEGNQQYSHQGHITEQDI